MLAKLFKRFMKWMFGNHHLPETVSQHKASQYILRKYEPYQDNPYTSFYVDLLYQCDKCEETAYLVYEPTSIVNAKFYGTSVACNCHLCGNVLEPIMYRDVVGFTKEHGEMRRLASGLWVKY